MPAILEMRCLYMYTIENNTIYRSECKIEKVINKIHGDVSVAISGGADSDILIDLFERLKYNLHANINYYFVDTGIEYHATKKHIEYLQERYNTDIKTIKPLNTVPYVVKHYGQPFINKRVSNLIERLQQHNFEFNNDLDFRLASEKYKNCRAALRWFYSDFGENSRYNITNNKLLFEFLQISPPTFAISSKCCDICKKQTMHQIKGDLNVNGIRKCEGGIRQKINNCFNADIAMFYPLLWYTNDDRKYYEYKYNIVHSDCYSVYGLPRTGCAGCPFAIGFENELEIIRKFEPQLYNAVNNFFALSYEYTREYRKFKGGVL